MAVWVVALARGAWGSGVLAMEFPTLRVERLMRIMLLALSENRNHEGSFVYTGLAAGEKVVFCAH
jgi:hypothetical protein